MKTHDPEYLITFVDAASCDFLYSLQYRMLTVLVLLQARSVFVGGAMRGIKVTVFMGHYTFRERK